MQRRMAHVLYVEDEAAHAKLVSRAFEAAASDCRLTIVSSLREAESAIQASLPDLVIADFLLPDGRGTELLACNGDGPAFPVVILTSHGDENLAVEALKAGALDYVVKSDSALADMSHVARRALREWKLICERKAIEAELVKNEAHLSLALEAAQIGTWEWNVDTGDVIWSDGVENILGLSREALGGRIDDYLEIIVPDDRERVSEKINRSAKTGEHCHAEYRIAVSEEAGVRWVESRGQVFLRSSSRPNRMVGTVMDVTERRKAEEMARERAVAQSKLEMLSPRENDVLNLVSAGEPNKTIAYRLELSEKTVEKHRARLMKKLQVRSVAELMRIALAAER